MVPPASMIDCFAASFTAGFRVPGLGHFGQDGQELVAHAGVQAVQPVHAGHDQIVDDAVVGFGHAVLHFKELLAVDVRPGVFLTVHNTLLQRAVNFRERHFLRASRRWLPSGPPERPTTARGTSGRWHRSARPAACWPTSASCHCARRPDPAGRGAASSPASPGRSSDAWKASTASMSLNMKGRSKMRNCLVNFSNFDSDGAASCTSPCSIASSTLLSL